jgi:hypothetical protein
VWPDALSEDLLHVQTYLPLVRNPGLSVEINCLIVMCRLGRNAPRRPRRAFNRRRSLIVLLQSGSRINRARSAAEGDKSAKFLRFCRLSSRPMS